MKVLFIGSGSKGNATIFISGDTMIEIDAGITCKRINLSLAPYAKSVRDLQAIFITHNHTDHIKELPRVCKNNALIYTGECTIDYDGYNLIHPGEGIDIDPFVIIPFSSHHDAPNPLNFIILVEGMKIGYVTDTGFVDEVALSLLDNCDYYIFESNYEPKLLEASSRPKWLKQRIRGKFGHLSNMQCGQYLRDLVGSKTKCVYLAHLSEECNDPEAALASAKRYLSKAKGLSKECPVVALKQWETMEAEFVL